jgi:hypothetical protein
LRVVATPTLAMGKGKIAKGKVAKPAKKDMHVKDNVHNMKTKAMHVTMHAMKNVKTTKVGMLVPNGEEEEDPVIFDDEPEEEPNDVVKEEEDKPCAKACYHFNSKLATALRLRRRKCPRSRHCHIAVASNVSCSKWLLPYKN